MKFLNVIPRWIVLQTDILVCSIALVLAYLLRFNFAVPESYYTSILLGIFISGVVKTVAFLTTKSYAGIIRYTSVEDAKRLMQAMLLSSTTLLLFDLISNGFFERSIIPISVVLIDFALSLLGMASFRILAKILYYESKSGGDKDENVIIYGAGEAGAITMKTLTQERAGQNVVAFIDDDKTKKNSLLEGAKIFKSKSLHELIVKHNVKTVVIAIQNISNDRKKDIVDSCLALDVQVRIIPPAQNWINGELSLKQIKDVRIEDILGRDIIELDKNLVSSDITGKTVMVTGAAGSIGSELVRQISLFKPKSIILFDQAETPLYELELELLEKPYKINFEVVIGDVSNKKRVEKIFDYYKPQYVFHAAAYKHVPMMEENPSEAILVNVFGTKIVADCSVKHQVDKFIMISTDKAVNPTNVMGASKRIAELYTQSLNNFLAVEIDKPTLFITTRFGNVLGSNGSVIPRFRKQIQEGGPLTITHPEITRFFMTIPEASQLVLEAAAIGNGGEVFLFDMGKSVKILDMAKKMIKLSGYELGKDVQIQFTGLRPGEKLYEELLTESEKTLPTHHPKITIGKFNECEYEVLEKELELLNEILITGNNKDLVSKMKQIVPEYKSKNSIYEGLDN